MSIRNILGGLALTVTALSFTQTAKAEEKPRQTQEQKEQAQTIYQRLKEQNLEKKLKDFRKARTKTQFSELSKKYKTILRIPLEEIINSQNNSTLLWAILRKLNIAGGLYKRTREALIEICTDPKMILYANITPEVKKAERDFKNILYALKKPPKYRRARILLDAYIEAEPIITTATYSFRDINLSRSSKLKTSKAETRLFTAILDLHKDIDLLVEITGMKKREILRILQKEQKELYQRIRRRAESTKEWNYFDQQSKEKHSSLYKFREKLKK